MPTHPPSPSLPADLTAATEAEIIETLSYALRYDERGKPDRSGSQFAAHLAAAWLAVHLEQAGFLVMKARSTRPHSAG